MGRLSKTGVDYFPHMVAHGETMFILEQRYGNDGYAVWFKILEMLGSKDGHFIDCRNGNSAWEYLQAKTHLSSDRLCEIVDLLGKLNAIDGELWGEEIIWCQKFVDHISDVYKKRKKEIPEKPHFCHRNPLTTPIPVTESTQRREEESKEKNIPPIAPQVSETEKLEKYSESFLSFWRSYPRKEGKGAAWRSWKKVKAMKDILPWLMKALEKQKKSEQWTKDNGQFIPQPAKWINQRRWEDQGITPQISGSDYVCKNCQRKVTVLYSSGLCSDCKDKISLKDNESQYGKESETKRKLQEQKALLLKGLP